jgi:hypothetical protein
VCWRKYLNIGLKISQRRLIREMTIESIKIGKEIKNGTNRPFREIVVI